MRNSPALHGMIYAYYLCDRADNQRLQLAIGTTMYLLPNLVE